MMKCKNCGTQLIKEMDQCPRCGKAVEKKRKSKPVVIAVICLVAVIVALAATVLMLVFNKNRDKGAGNPGTFDFTCSEYTDEMNRILGEEKIKKDKWVIDKTNADYSDSDFEIHLDIDEKNEKVSAINIGPTDNANAVKIAAVSIMATESKIAQKDALGQLADLTVGKKDKIENDRSFVTINKDKKRFEIKPKKDKNDHPATTSATTQSTTEAKHEYTAEELIEKDLDEIIEIMGGDFDIDTEKSVAFGTDGSVLWIYNDSALPGFAFSPKIYYDYSTDLSEYKSRIKNGEKDYQGLIVTGNAKYNDTVSANMTYNELAQLFGDFDMGAAGAEGHYYHGETINGRNVSFCIVDSDKKMSERSENGQISSSDLKELNPALSEISVRHEAKNAEPTNEPTEKPTEEVTDAPVETDYSSYLGMWSYIDVPDEIPEEIRNNEVTYNQYMNERPRTNLNFQKIEGDTATFELSKGNIKFVSDTVVTAKIVDNQISFEYTDSWNGKGHGTITLNGDTVHVNCVEDEHGTGRNSLDCDDTLTRE